MGRKTDIAKKAIGLPITGVIVAMKNCRQMDACICNAGEVGACGGITKVIKAGSLGDWGSGVEKVSAT